MRYARMSLGWFIYTCVSREFFGISQQLRKDEHPPPPCLLRVSLAYIFSGLLIWMQYVKRVCGKQNGVFEPKFLVYREEIKGSETFFRLIFPKKNWFSRKSIHQFSISDAKICCLPGRLGKHIKFIYLSFVTIFVYTTDEIPSKIRACLLRFSGLKVNHTCAI